MTDEADTVRPEDPGEASGSSRLLANSSALLLSRLGVAALGWVGSVLIIRSLSVDDFGRFTLLFSILGLLSVITDMGIGRVAIAMFVDPDVDQARLGGRYVTLRALLGVVGYLVALAVVGLGGFGPQLFAATLVGGLVVILSTVANAHQVVFQAHERMRLPALVWFLATTAQLATIALLSVTTTSLVLFTVPAVLASVVEVCVIVPAARRIVPLRYGVDLGLWRRMLAEAVPISVGGAMATLYYRIDGVMLGQLATLRDVAVYGVAYKFVDIVHVLPYVVSVAATPRLVKRWPEQPVAFRAEFEHAALLLAVAAGFVIAEFEALAPHVVPFLYGEEYSDAVAPARIVMLSECVAFFGAAALMALIASAHHRLYPWIAAAGLALNVGLNLVLIPRFGVIGASWATVATDLTVAGSLWVVMHRTRVLRGVRLQWWWRVASACAGALVLAVLLERVLPWLLVAVLTAVIYLGLLVLLRALGPGGLSQLRRMGAPEPTTG